MTTNGTIGKTTIDVDTLISHAYRRSGMSSGEITAEMGKSGRELLYFYLSNLANHGVQMWTISRDIYGTQAGTNKIYLPHGTVEVLNANRRIVQSVISSGFSSSGTSSSAFDLDPTTYCSSGVNGYVGAYISSSPVTSVGILSYGSQSLTPVIEYTIDGTNWLTLYTPPPDPGSTTIDLTDNQWAWWDIPTSYPTAVAYRVRETGGATLNLREVQLSNNPLEINLGRLNRDDYSNLPNKSLTGLPLNYWYSYDIEQPTMWLWPVPDNAFYQIVVFRSRHIQDVGALTSALEVPQRWHNAIMANLAALMALEIPGADLQRYTLLQQLADKATYEAEEAERDNSPIYLYPNIGVYSK